MTDTLHLGPGWEPGDGSADGAMLVDDQWYHPVMGCDSLQFTVDNMRAYLALARAGVDPNRPGGNSPPVPIPLSLRQPGPKDRDDFGRCWYAGVSAESGHLCWGLQPEAYCMDRYWIPAGATCLPMWPDPALMHRAAMPSGTTPP